MYKLNERQVVEIRQRLRNGEPEKDLADEYHVTHQAINLIHRGQTHKGLGPDASVTLRPNRHQRVVRTAIEMAKAGFNAEQIAMATNRSGSYICILSKIHGFKIVRKKSVSRVFIRHHISREDARAIRVLRKRSVPVTEIAAIFGLKRANVYRILRNEIWKE